MLVHVTDKTLFSNTDHTDSGDIFIAPSLVPVDVNQEINLTDHEQKKTLVHYAFCNDIAPTLILHLLIAGCISRNVSKKGMLWW